MALPQVQASPGMGQVRPVTTSEQIAKVALAFSTGITKQESADVSTKAANVSLTAAQQLVIEAEAAVAVELSVTSGILAAQHAAIDSLLTLLGTWKVENPLPAAPSPGG